MAKWNCARTPCFWRRFRNTEAISGDTSATIAERYVSEATSSPPVQWLISSLSIVSVLASIARQYDMQERSRRLFNYAECCALKVIPPFQLSRFLCLVEGLSAWPNGLLPVRKRPTQQRGGGLLQDIIRH